MLIKTPVKLLKIKIKFIPLLLRYKKYRTILIAAAPFPMHDSFQLSAALRDSLVHDIQVSNKRVEGYNQVEITNIPQHKSYSFSNTFCEKSIYHNLIKQLVRLTLCICDS